MKETLHELTARQRGLLDNVRLVETMIADAEGEVTDETSAAYDRLLDEIDAGFETLAEKLEAYGVVMDEQNAAAAAEHAKAEVLLARVTEIRRRADLHEKTADRLKERAHSTMLELGIKKIETPQFRFTVARNGGIQPFDIPDMAAVPPEFIRTKEWVDRSAVSKHLKALDDGQVPHWVVKLERGTHLKIS